MFGIIIILSCSTHKPLVKIKDSSAQPDSTEYVVIVLEAGFEQWLATNRKPVWFYEENYYKHFNQLYTNEWNNRVRDFQYDWPFIEPIDYNNTIEYGIEVEHKLYWYFKFMMEKYDFKLLVTERP